MTKNFQIDDILNAVNVISKSKKKRIKSTEKNAFVHKGDVLNRGNQAKSNNSEILVLNQMIE